jgi:hypothetical protein
VFNNVDVNIRETDCWLPSFNGKLQASSPDFASACGSPLNTIPFKKSSGAARAARCVPVKTQALTGRLAPFRFMESP